METKDKETCIPEPSILYSPNDEYLESNVGIGEVEIPATLLTINKDERQD